MQCYTGFILASPTVARHFQRISLLGSLQNAILLLCTHAENYARRLWAGHASWHRDSPAGPPTAMSRSRYAHVAEEDCSIVEYERFAVSWTHGYLALTL